MTEPGCGSDRGHSVILSSTRLLFLDNWWSCGLTFVSVWCLCSLWLLTTVVPHFNIALAVRHEGLISEGWKSVDWQPARLTGWKEISSCEQNFAAGSSFISVPRGMHYASRPLSVIVLLKARYFHIPAVHQLRAICHLLQPLVPLFVQHKQGENQHFHLPSCESWEDFLKVTSTHFELPKKNCQRDKPQTDSPQLMVLS